MTLIKFSYKNNVFDKNRLAILGLIFGNNLTRFNSPQVKQSLTSSFKNLKYNLPNKLLKISNLGGGIA